MSKKSLLSLSLALCLGIALCVSHISCGPQSAELHRNLADPKTDSRTSVSGAISSRMIAVVYYAAPADNDCRNESKQFFQSSILSRIGPCDEVCWIYAHGTFIPDRDVVTCSMPCLPITVLQGQRLKVPKDLLEQKKVQTTLTRTWQDTLRLRKTLFARVGGPVTSSELAGERATVKPLEYALRRLAGSNANHKYLILLGNAQPPSFPQPVPGLEAVVDLFAVYPNLAQFDDAKSQLNKDFSRIGARHFLMADKAESTENNKVSQLLSDAGIDSSGVPTRAALPEGFQGE